MKFSFFKNAKSQTGQECTYELFIDTLHKRELLDLCKKIAAEEDADKRGELKKQLPVVTWQAYFEGRRKASEAQPSGLFMLDIDHVENPYKLYTEKVCGRKTELGIVFVGKTASCHGLRIVALCRNELKTLEECQRWLAGELGVEYDGVCKDWARCSFLVHESYTYYLDAAAIWMDIEGVGAKYDVCVVAAPIAKSEVKSTPLVDQREGLFGGQVDYKGFRLEDIALEWLKETGGEPTMGERSARLYRLALRMRYICDFNAATMLRVMPRYGLSEDEMKSIVDSALKGTRAATWPKDLDVVIETLKKTTELTDDVDDIEDLLTDTEKMPKLPPIFREFMETAPDDFKQAVVLCQLPILGALGSKLRARYIDGRVHSPSFQVSLEAPQASGKSFMTRLAEYELGMMIEHDKAQREQELEYDKRVREMKLLNVKVTPENKDEILGQRPKALIRYCSPKMSITKLLMRLHSAQGLHLFALAEEIDTVTKTFKTGFSSYSDLLRIAFDNGSFGQDYASENSFSGIVNVYYNVLFSGTPKAMRRFYPDVEDGLISRVLFVTLPDQFGKRMPVWKDLDAKQKAIVDIGLVKLNEISIQGDKVQEEHYMKLDFLNSRLQDWLLVQQAQAVKDNDRTRDIFCRRAAVVGFRAGMLAWFLWNEVHTPTIRKNVCEFAVWVANCMLNQHLLRFNIKGTSSNINQWEDAFNMLGDEFTREDLRVALCKCSHDTPDRVVLSKWRLAGVIKDVAKDDSGKRGRRGTIKFKKTN